jgi:phage-related protein
MWQQREQQMNTQLINQGLRPGTEAYSNASRDFNVGRNDAYQQAIMAGINTMPQTYQMASALRNQPLNELNALRTGAQVTNPQFQQAPQQQTAPGANMLGAAQSQYGGALDGYNAQVGQDNAMTSGLFSLAGSGMTAFAL